MNARTPLIAAVRLQDAVDRFLQAEHLTLSGVDELVESVLGVIELLAPPIPASVEGDALIASIVGLHSVRA